MTYDGKCTVNRPMSVAASSLVQSERRHGLSPTLQHLATVVQWMAHQRQLAVRRVWQEPENWVPRMCLTTSKQGIADPRRGSNERIPVLSLCLPAAPLFIFQCLFRSSRSQSPARRVDLSAHGKDAPPVSWEWEVGRLYQLKDCCKCFLSFFSFIKCIQLFYIYMIYIYIYIVIRSSSIKCSCSWISVPWRKSILNPWFIVTRITFSFDVPIFRFCEPRSLSSTILSTGCPWKDCGTIVLFLDCILGISWKLSCNCTMSFCTSCTWAALFPK